VSQVEQAIREAVQQGYKPKLDRTPEMQGFTTVQIAMAMSADVFLDRHFWLALAESRKWSDRYCADVCGCDLAPAPQGVDKYICVNCEVEYSQADVDDMQPKWLFNWHRFIDHIAGRKDEESFFLELLADAPST
jgi:hypothetical protein